MTLLTRSMHSSNTFSKTRQLMTFSYFHQTFLTERALHAILQLQRHSVEAIASSNFQLHQVRSPFSYFLSNRFRLCASGTEPENAEPLTRSRVVLRRAHLPCAFEVGRATGRSGRTDGSGTVDRRVCCNSVVRCDWLAKSGERPLAERSSLGQW